MKLGMMIRAADPIEQDLCAQLGVKYAITKAAPELTGMNAPWDLEALRTVQERFTSRGITLYGLEGDEFDMTRIKLGLPGRDEDLAKYCQMLENMGALGIKLICYNFNFTRFHIRVNVLFGTECNSTYNSSNVFAL